MSSTTPSATASASESPPPPAADVRACAGVEAIIRHITVDTARWSPTTHPFDKTISRRLASQAISLATQVPPGANPKIRQAVGSTASAFNDVASAMKSRKRARVTRAIARSRVAYKQLKQACSLPG